MNLFLQDCDEKTKLKMMQSLTKLNENQTSLFDLYYAREPIMFEQFHTMLPQLIQLTRGNCFELIDFTI